jgi:hypothetical protein
MAVSRHDVAAFVIGLLGDQFHLPASYFNEDDDLRKAWLFDDASLVGLGKTINESNWHDEFVTPLEMVKCVAIKDVIDLLWNKIK